MSDVTTRSQLQEFWGEHVACHRNSDMSMAAYCRDNDLPYHQMVYWSSKFAGEGCSVADATTASAPLSALIPIRIACEPSTAGSSTGLSVRLPSGIVVTGITADTVGLLNAVVHAL